MKTSFLLFFALIFTQAHAQRLETIKRMENDSLYLDFINPLLAPVEMSLKAKDSVKSYIKLKSYFVLSPKDTVYNGFVIPKSKLSKNSGLNLSDFASISGTFGDPNTVAHNDDYLYSLPFPKGKRYKIMQGFNGKFSHRLESSKYAIDFDIKVGDTICAARDGIVIFTKENSKEHGPTRAYMGKANKVIIMHEDGTFAQYLHLDYQGALVDVGEKVKVGQIIGISGFTGFTTKPHLHFVIKRDKEISIPFYFKNYERKVLKQNKKYGH